MFGLMEIQELLNSYNNLYPDYSGAIVPTILLPLAFLSTGISVVATFIAGLFGVKLKAEGPKKLLELLLRPKIIISTLILNAIIFFGLKGFQHIKNGPVPLIVQNAMNTNINFSKEADLSDKRVIWGQSVEEGIFARGTLVKDELFVGTKEGTLFVLDVKSGKVKNKIFFGKFLSPTPIYYKGYLYFGEGLHASHHMRVYKFDPVSKKTVSSFKTNGHTEILPVFASVGGVDYLFQAAGADGIYALNPETMQKRWQFVDGHMDGFALVDGDYLYVGSGVPREDLGKMRPYAYKLELKTGKLIWKKELPLSSWYGPLKYKDSICFIQGELHVKSSIGGINCFSSIGERVSSVLIEGPVIGKPFVYKDNIIFNDFNGHLYSWNPIEKKINWKLLNNDGKAKYSYSSALALNESKLLFVSSLGMISQVDMESGKLLKKEKFSKEKERVFADPLILKDSFIIFGMNGNIKKFKINE